MIPEGRRLRAKVKKAARIASGPSRMSGWAEAHDERARRPKVRPTRGRRGGAGGQRRRRGGTGERGDGRLRERVGRRGGGGREERVAAVRGALLLLLLAVGPAAVRLLLLGPVGSPRVAGQAEAEDEARDEERRHQAQEDLGGLAHVAAHRKLLPSALLLLPLLLSCAPPLSALKTMHELSEVRLGVEENGE